MEHVTEYAAIAAGRKAPLRNLIQGIRRDYRDALSHPYTRGWRFVMRHVMIWTFVFVGTLGTVVGAIALSGGTLTGLISLLLGPYVLIQARRFLAEFADHDRGLRYHDEQLRLFIAQLREQYGIAVEDEEESK